MKKEYDFSHAKKGLFYRKDAKLIPPIHLKPDILASLTQCAKERGTTLNDLVNELLKQDIERLESVK